MMEDADRLPNLLTLSTEDQQGDTRKRSNVKVYCDAVSYIQEDYGPNFKIMAMSIIGPEQAIRAIAAGCSLDQIHHRTLLSFRSEDHTIIRGKWAWGWKNVQAKLMVTGAMHLVVTADTMRVGAAGSELEHRFITPEGTDDDDIYRAIYQVLMTKFSTPLIPCDRVGQPPNEKLAGQSWRSWICNAIVNNADFWKEATSHPGQPNREWARAGILTMSDKDLDGIVSGLVRQGRITIPTPAKEVA